MYSRVFPAFLMFVLLFLVYSCGNNKQESRTYTSGATKILADESFRPIVEDELYVFQNTYPRAEINMEYYPENVLLNRFLNDSARVAVLSRKLSPEELKVFERRKLVPRVTRFAIDAVALITHKSSKDTAITVQEIIDIMQEKAGQSRQLFFDNPNSSTVRYLIDLAHVKALPSKGVYALKSNAEVIEYVYNNPGTIGVIGVNWIEQLEKDLEQYVASIKALSVKNVPGKEGSDKFYRPTQSNLALGTYPLTRSLYIINCEGGPGLGAGFASFLAGEKGQRIVLKSGLLPDSIPSREILIRK